MERESCADTEVERTAGPWNGSTERARGNWEFYNIFGSEPIARDFDAERKKKTVDISKGEKNSKRRAPHQIVIAGNRRLICRRAGNEPFPTKFREEDSRRFNDVSLRYSRKKFLIRRLGEDLGYPVVRYCLWLQWKIWKEMQKSYSILYFDTNIVAYFRWLCKKVIL